jgi:hypothetical protein
VCVWVVKTIVLPKNSRSSRSESEEQFSSDERQRTVLSRGRAQTDRRPCLALGLAVTRTAIIRVRQQSTLVSTVMRYRFRAPLGVGRSRASRSGIETVESQVFAKIPQSFFPNAVLFPDMSSKVVEDRA